MFCSPDSLAQREGCKMSEVDAILDKAGKQMDKVIANLEDNFANVRTGRANAMVLNRISVDYYGTQTPINQMAGIKTPEAHLLVIEPWDKSALKDIERAILDSDLGVTPNSDGMVIRLPFPPLTEERRKELAKQCRTYAEEARIAVRNARRDGNNAAQRAQKENDLPEDQVNRAEKAIQKMTDERVAKIDELLKKKEAELMEV